MFYIHRYLFYNKRIQPFSRHLFVYLFKFLVWNVLTFNISDSKRKDTYYTIVLLVFKKDSPCFHVADDTLSWWFISRPFGRQAEYADVIHWPVCSLPEGSRAVFGNRRRGGGATESLQQRCSLKLQVWLANVTRVKRQDLLDHSTPFRSNQLMSWLTLCQGKCLCQNKCRNSMWLDVPEQEGSCQASLLICFHPPPVCAWLDHSVEAVQA